MPFHAGRVSFCRFRVEGDAPDAVDDTTLATLAEFAFAEREIGAPDEIESGWTTGEHLLDTQFTYEKNGYGADATLLLFALRIDTHRVPGDLKHAYRRMNELAVAAASPTGFASKRERRDAKETAQQQVREDLAAGKHRKSKAVPLLWDLKGRTLYCAAPSNKVMELLSSQFHQSFNAKLTHLSSGALAGDLLRASGKGRDYEDLLPSPFTAPPDGAALDHEDADKPRDVKIPAVPWVKAATDMKDFLGNEFAIWLWWMIEAGEGLVKVETDAGKAEVAVMVDAVLDMECAWGVLGKQALRAGGPTRLAEAGVALASGKWPRKAGLVIADNLAGDGVQWKFTLQADRWTVSGATLPEVPDAQTPREATEARLANTRQLASMLDGLFKAFLSQRVSSGWAAKRRAIHEWIVKRKR